jgi:hypothetical protein
MTLQYWRKSWTRLTAIFGIIFLIGLAAGYYYKIWAFCLLYGLLILFVFIPMWVSRLTTEVREDGIHIRYYPWHLWWTRTILLEQIQDFEVRNNVGILDTGGYGIRASGFGISYNVSGKMGVLVHVSKTDPVWIGSQHPEGLAKAIGDAIEKAGYKTNASKRNTTS